MLTREFRRHEEQTRHSLKPLFSHFFLPTQPSITSLDFCLRRAALYPAELQVLVCPAVYPRFIDAAILKLGGGIITLADAMRLQTARVLLANSACDGRGPVLTKTASGCSSMVEQQLPKLTTRVRFPSPAPVHSPTFFKSRAAFLYYQARQCSRTCVSFSLPRSVHWRRPATGYFKKTKLRLRIVDPLG